MYQKKLLKGIIVITRVVCKTSSFVPDNKIVALKFVESSKQLKLSVDRR